MSQLTVIVILGTTCKKDFPIQAAELVPRFFYTEIIFFLSKSFLSQPACFRKQCSAQILPLLPLASRIDLRLSSMPIAL